MNRFKPYTSEDYEKSFCLKRAKELRETGEFLSVVVRYAGYENGKTYARIWIKRKEVKA